MTPSIWIWQFLRPVSPVQAVDAVRSSGLDESWIPEVPFAQVAERAVGDIRAKRTTETGVIIWEAKGKKWFADLVTKEMVFEAPRSKTAKTIMDRLDSSRELLPRDLSAYMLDLMAEWGSISLLGDLWLVPEYQPQVLSMLRAIPGAAVAAIPVDGQVAGEVLALMAGRMQAEAERAIDGIDALKPETLRRRAASLRDRAEEVERLASMFGIDLGALGQILLDAEGVIRDKIGGRTRYEAPLDFGGDAPMVPAHQDNPIRTIPVVDRPDVPGEGTYRKEGDPPPSAPPLKVARKIDDDQ